MELSRALEVEGIRKSRPIHGGYRQSGMISLGVPYQLHVSRTRHLDECGVTKVRLVCACFSQQQQALEVGPA